MKSIVTLKYPNTFYTSVLTIEIKEVIDKETGKTEQIRIFRCNYCKKTYEPYKCDVLEKHMTSIHGEHVNVCMQCHDKRFNFYSGAKSTGDFYWKNPKTGKYEVKQ